MSSEDLIPPTACQPVVVGTGLVALDVVIPDSPGAPVRFWAGGTCANVLTNLAYLGWAAYPIARIGDDAPARLVVQDLETWGVRPDFLLRDGEGGTPVVVQHIRAGTAGEATHSFSWRCPVCGSNLPRYRAVRLADLERNLPHMPRAEAFFFDRTSAAALRAAQHFATQGTLVVFEPSGVGDVRLFRDTLASTHILKFSGERLGGADEALAATQPWLVVETLGQNGLRYRSRLRSAAASDWQKLSSFPAADVRDTAGSGDWCTAGILSILGQGGLDGFLQVDPSRLGQALRFGQALAAWNCGFEGARGGMYAVSKSVFEESVRALLGGGLLRPNNEGKPSAEHPEQNFACASCSKK
jgi:fructokinase